MYSYLFRLITHCFHFPPAPATAPRGGPPQNPRYFHKTKSIRRHYFGFILLFLILLLTVGIQLFRYNDTAREAFGHFLFGDTPTQIENGFIPELTEMLSEKYGLTIPENAEFIRGDYTNAFRDPAAVIEFRLPAATEDMLFDRLLSDEKWEPSPSQADPALQNTLIDSDIVYQKVVDSFDGEYISLFYTVTGDGSIS